MNSINIEERLRTRLTNIYGSFPLTEKKFKEFLDELTKVRIHSSRDQRWDEKDIILITYGDSIKQEGEKPLNVLHSFLKKHMEDTISHVHILPFFPYSSDDGFSVIDYSEVDPQLGSWSDIEKLGKDFELMFDLVINHISQHSKWFQNHLKGIKPGKDFFIEVDPDTDLSAVVRPRSLPLLSEYDTHEGKKHIWTTFSADQVDLNFGNPEVLIEMMKVFLLYLAKGAQIIRLDAIAFLWKEIGTSCLHLPQTHEVVKLMRDLAEYIDSGIILLTETNVPNKENLSYFGDGDEASMVYQFSLPPLLLHALYTTNSSYLNKWAQSLSNLPEACTFFNFTASHDGIGVRPLEGLLPQKEILELAEAMKSAGGYISTKRNSDGSDSPYEMNITYYDAMKQTPSGVDEFQFERFICSQTLMMSFGGIPAFYIHSLFGTENYHEGVKKTGMPRTINRRKWEVDELEEQLQENSNQQRILKELIRRISIRKSVKAFHPDVPQQVIEAENDFFVLSRGTNSELIVMVNLSAHMKKISTERDFLADCNFDLLAEEAITDESINFAPYQVRWLRK